MAGYQSGMAAGLGFGGGYGNVGGYGNLGAYSQAETGEIAANRIKNSSATSIVQLEFSCNKLKDKDVFSKSDPFVVVFLQDKETLQNSDLSYEGIPGRSQSGKPIQFGFKELGRTEMIKNSLNPQFVTKVEIPYFFEEVQTLVFAVFDKDSKKETLAQQDKLGYAMATMGELVASTPVWTKPLEAKLGSASGGSSFDMFHKRISGPLLTPIKAALGTISIRVHEMKRGQFALYMEPSAFNLDKKDLFGKSDPYFVLRTEKGYDPSVAHPQSVLYKSEIIKKSLNVTWKPVKLKIPADVYNMPLELSVWDYDEIGAHDLIGTATVVLSRLADPAETLPIEIPLINDKKASKKKYTNSGTFRLTTFSCVEIPTFLQYIQGGLRLNFSVGIDFTASNGFPDSTASLHYLGDGSYPITDPNFPPVNEYLHALFAIGNVLQDYDNDRRFPALGFGGRLLDGTVSFNFCLNGQADPTCVGIEGIVQAYTQALGVIKLSGPTNFAPLIRHVAELTRRGGFSHSNQFYNVLLIITDGEITDMQDTKSAIVEASHEPMSIIIVGVGTANFDPMIELDSDRTRLRDMHGQVAIRDIVQFVPLEKFRNLSLDRFSAAVLQELPANIVQYMHDIKHMKPNTLQR